MNEFHGRRWALLVFSTIMTSASSQTAVELARALDCYQARRYTEARERFERVARQRPADPEIDFYLGRLALWFDEEAAALRHLERAAQQAPRDARILNALGDAYGLAAQQANPLMKISWAGKCRVAYERAIALEPGNAIYRWSLLGYCCVAPRLLGGGRDKAHAQAEAIAALDPAGGRVARATLALAEAHYDAAFGEFEAVLQEVPDDFLALYQIGRCAALSGERVERGIAALQRCLELIPPAGDDQPTLAGVHYRLGNLLEKKRDEIGAAAQYAAARRAEPDFRAKKIKLKN